MTVTTPSTDRVFADPKPPSYAQDGKMRLRTSRGIRYELLNGFPTYSYSHEGSAATAQYRIFATDLKFFMDELFPPPKFIGGFLEEDTSPSLPGSTMLFPLTASVAPASESLPMDAHYTDHRTIGSGTRPQEQRLTADEWAQSYSQYAIVTVEYENRMPYNGSKPATFLEHSISVGGEFLAISEQGTGWRSSEEFDLSWTPVLGTEDFEFPPVDPSIDPPLPVQAFLNLKEANLDFKVPATKVIPTIEHQLRWRNVIEPPWDRIRQAIGLVNSSKLSFLDDAKAETVMFLGVTGTRRFRSSSFSHDRGINPPLHDDGQGDFDLNQPDQWTNRHADIALWPWTLDFKFTERRMWKPREEGVPPLLNPDDDQFKIAITWNYVYRPATGIFEVLYRADGTKLYDTVDMNEMFRRDIRKVGKPIETFAAINSDSISEFIRYDGVDLLF